MSEPFSIDLLVRHFRLSKSAKVFRTSFHLLGKDSCIEAEGKHYFLQFYETIHSKKQIQNDIDLLRKLANLGFDVPLPLISRSGESIDTSCFSKTIVLYARPKCTAFLLNREEIGKIASEIPQIETLINHNETLELNGKKISAIFTMFELLSREERAVDDEFKSEYYAHKAAYIDFMNGDLLHSFAFFPGPHRFLVSKEGRCGFSHTNFLYLLPELFALSQFILYSCFTQEGVLDYEKLDQATISYATASRLSSASWSHFDAVLKFAAFFEVICHWITLIYHPHSTHTDNLIEARKKWQHLKKLTLKEIG